MFVATEVVDVGYIDNRFERDPEAEPIRSCVIRGYFAHEGQAHPVATDCRLAFTAGANLIKWATAGRGGKVPARDDTVDPAEFVGVPMMVKITSSPRQGSTDYYLRLAEPQALIEGLEVPECLHEYITVEPPTFVWWDESRLEKRRALVMESRREGEGPPLSDDDAPPPRRPPASRPTANFPEGWEAARNAFAAVAQESLAKFGFSPNANADERTRALNSFWKMFEDVPHIIAARNDRGGFGITPGNYSVEELEIGADILRRFNLGGSKAITDEDRRAREADEPFPEFEDSESEPQETAQEPAHAASLPE